MAEQDTASFCPSKQPKITRLMDVLQEIEPDSDELNDLLKPENWPVLVSEGEEMFHSIPNLTFSELDEQGNLASNISNLLVAPNVLNEQNFHSDFSISHARSESALNIEEEVNSGNHNTNDCAIPITVNENDDFVSLVHSQSATEVAKLG